MKILDQLKRKHQLSGGHCGLYIIQFEGDRESVKKELNTLQKEGKITIHDALHGRLYRFKLQETISNNNLIK